MNEIVQDVHDSDLEGENDEMERIIENGDDGNDNAEAIDGEQPEVEEQLLLESFEHYLEQHGLRSQDDYNEPNLNFVEEKERIESEKSYQERIIQAAMQNNEDANPAKKAREECLQTLKGETMDIHTSNGHKIQHIPLRTMADKCDFIYCMISSRPFFESKQNADNENGRRQEKDSDNSKDDLKSSSSRTTISLDTYDISSVRFFLDAVFRGKPLDPESLSTYESENDNISSPAVTQSFNRIIEGVQIAHYLQCKDVLEYLVEVMLQPGFVTTDNCSFLVEFSDQYELPRLFESALEHAMTCLGNLESMDVWKEFTPELRQRIEEMKIAIHTSIHQNPYTTSKGNQDTKKQKTQPKPKKLYFSSITEYLAIFAENVQYHRERLEDAKHEQEQLLNRHQQQQQEQQRRGFGLLLGHRHPHNVDNEIDIRQSRGYQYAAEKIAKQEERVRTFEAVMKEQKKLFSSSHYHYHK
eukprot:CAMPEP_0195285808 /NCGR_PEP_ID=MMETSP0707-20130614/3511_1 /TAXON_ID=33640 /ORGANISM="Asterionellopsis glacialis, Strain CCMP134" /LENGTH=469 /DNA_ID=CAMNT_0040345361 /DNA_START=33 /DNA_END=1442 /DNA_ORIENTATION=+